MKVTIGKFKSYIGPYQIAELLMKAGVSRDRCDKLGEWLSETWVNGFFTWLDTKRTRVVKVRIDPWDTWSMDRTLAPIILPMLKQIKGSKYSSGTIDDEDVPDHLRSTGTVTENGVDGNYFARWEWAIDQMIFSFEKISEEDWQSEFHHGVVDFVLTPIDKDGNVVDEKDAAVFKTELGMNHTANFDFEGLVAMDKRIQKGLTLFGKYYSSLWE